MITFYSIFIVLVAGSISLLYFTKRRLSTKLAVVGLFMSIVLVTILFINNVDGTPRVFNNTYEVIQYYDLNNPVIIGHKTYKKKFTYMLIDNSPFPIYVRINFSKKNKKEIRKGSGVDKNGKSKGKLIIQGNKNTKQSDVYVKFKPYKRFIKNQKIIPLEQFNKPK